MRQWWGVRNVRELSIDFSNKNIFLQNFSEYFQRVPVAGFPGAGLVVSESEIED